MKYNKETDEYILSANEMCLYRDASTTLPLIQKYLSESISAVLNDVRIEFSQFMSQTFGEEMSNNEQLMHQYHKDKNITDEVESMTHRALDLGNGFNLVIEGDFQKKLKQAISFKTLVTSDLDVRIYVEKRKGL